MPRESAFLTEAIKAIANSLVEYALNDDQNVTSDEEPPDTSSISSTVEQLCRNQFADILFCGTSKNHIIYKFFASCAVLKRNFLSNHD